MEAGIYCAQVVGGTAVGGGFVGAVANERFKDILEYVRCGNMLGI